MTFLFPVACQIFSTGLIFIFIWGMEKLIFPYRFTLDDDPNSSLYYQIDPDALPVILVFIFPVAIISVILSILTLLLFTNQHERKKKLFKIILLIGILEIGFCIYRLIELIAISNSLVHCDKIVIGKTLGCYIS